MTARFACASLFCRNFSTQTGVRAVTTAVSARSAASLSAVPPVIQPPQENPTTIDATAPMAAPCSRRLAILLEGLKALAWHFLSSDTLRTHWTPGWVPVQQVELMTRTLCVAYRLILAYAFVRRESEQNSSLQLLQGAAVEVLRFSSLGVIAGLSSFQGPCSYVRRSGANPAANLREASIFQFFG